MGLSILFIMEKNRIILVLSEFFIESEMISECNKQSAPHPPPPPQLKIHFNTFAQDHHWYLICVKIYIFTLYRYKND